MRTVQWDTVVRTTSGESVQVLSSSRVRVRRSGGVLEVDGVEVGRVSGGEAERLLERTGR